MRSRLMTWIWKQPPRSGCNELVLDFREASFVEPWALTQFVSYALWVRESSGIAIRAETEASNPANIYLLAMGLNEVLETGQSQQHWDDSRQNTGLHILRTHADVQRFVQSASILGPNATADTFDALRYGMQELGRNVVQHAQSPIGGVAIAQYFPDRKALQISISDRGRGVRESLQDNYPEVRSDLEACKLAVLPHASGAASPVGPYESLDNAGLGLFFSKEIAWRAGGSFWLVSGTALLGVTGDDEAAQRRIYRRINPWSGTSVTLDFPADGVAVAFWELLRVCQDLAQQSRVSSGKAGLDFLDEMPEGFTGKVVTVLPFAEDVEVAAKVRRETLMPAVNAGEEVVLDFEGIRFATQSFAHALLYEPLCLKGSLLRLSFLNCTRASMEAIKTVAAYAASYRQIP